MGITTNDLSFVKDINSSFTDLIKATENKSNKTPSINKLPSYKINSLGGLKEVDNKTLEADLKTSDMISIDDIRENVNDLLKNEEVRLILKDVVKNTSIELDATTLAKIRSSLVEEVSKKLDGNELTLKAKNDLKSLIKKLCNGSGKNRFNLNKNLKDMLKGLGLAELLKLIRCIGDPATYLTNIVNGLKSAPSKAGNIAFKSILKTGKIDFAKIGKVVSDSTINGIAKTNPGVGKLILESKVMKNKETSNLDSESKKIILNNSLYAANDEVYNSDKTWSSFASDVAKYKTKKTASGLSTDTLISVYSGMSVNDFDDPTFHKTKSNDKKPQAVKNETDFVSQLGIKFKEQQFV